MAKQKLEVHEPFCGHLKELFLLRQQVETERLLAYGKIALHDRHLQEINIQIQNMVNLVVRESGANIQPPFDFTDGIITGTDGNFEENAGSGKAAS